MAFILFYAFFAIDIGDAKNDCLNEMNITDNYGNSMPNNSVLEVSLNASKNLNKSVPALKNRHMRSGNF